MDNRLLIRVTDADRGAATSLRTWLRAEPELRGRVELTAAPPRPGSLGTLADVLTGAAGPFESSYPGGRGPSASRRSSAAGHPRSARAASTARWKVG
ncbi:hypothetical protein ABZW30_15325 [Kitasatospora sp. NPDC004669]|uniref:effector-associated constant component EACC1 n=1 Tax=Kitasatospora sp. NPDC004669 TaxID=3154555 RepID=UPI0033AA5FB7